MKSLNVLYFSIYHDWSFHDEISKSGGCDVFAFDPRYHLSCLQKTNAKKFHKGGFLYTLIQLSVKAVLN